MRNRVFDVEHIAKSFRSGFWLRKVDAIKDVSFSVSRGEVFGIVGANGAGKTTTLKILTGIIPKDSGRLLINGAEVTDKSREFRRLLGFLPENPYFYEHLRIEELLRFYGQVHGMSQIELSTRVPMLIERVGLSNASDRPISKFSKGMRQRAGIAQALINDPEIVILDEPQTGLDPFGRKDVRDLILELKSLGKTVIFSSHILPDVEAVCDRLVIFKDGITVRHGTLGELTHSSESVYEIVFSGPAEFDGSGISVSKHHDTTIVQVHKKDLQNLLKDLVAQPVQILSISTMNRDIEAALLQEMKGSNEN